MSGKKKNRDFLSGGAIQQADMLAYLRNELSASEREQFEKLLSADPFAQEALEGLQSSENITPAAEKIAAINQKLRQKTGLKETKLVKVHWANYAYAAAVFGVLIGLGFLIVQFATNQKNELAMNKAETAKTEQELFESSTAEALVTDTSAMAAVAADSLSLTTTTAVTTGANTAVVSPTEDVLKKEEKKTAPLTDPAAPATGAVMNSTVVASDNAGAAVPAAAPSKSVTKANMDDAESALQQAGYKDAKRQKEVAAIETTSKRNADEATAKPEPTIDEAMKSFNSANYSQASEQFEQVLKKQPDNAEALYFGGISDYLTGKSVKSEKSFDKLLKSNRYSEGSKWYKANILLKKGKKDEALKMLNELSGTSGMYKERAVKKLEELK